MSKTANLSVTLATYNEAENLDQCLYAIKDIANEIIIVDGSSIDDTVKIARKYGAKVTIKENPENFHINKQLANNLAKGEWILQLDADEVVSEDLANEIRQILKTENCEPRIAKNNKKLFKKHQKLLEQRDGQVGTNNPNDPIVAYFISRRNYFLGKFLKYGGTYPDGVIRLFKKNKAYLPCQTVHEQYQVDGRVSWLNNYLLHYDSPTFKRYLERNNRYSSLFAQQLQKQNTPLTIFNYIKYLILKPTGICLKLYFRHKAFLDGFPGLVWSWYSGKIWADAYVKYWEKNNKNHETKN